MSPASTDFYFHVKIPNYEKKAMHIIQSFFQIHKLVESNEEYEALLAAHGGNTIH